MKFSILLILLVVVVNVAEGWVCPCKWQFYWGNANCYLFSHRGNKWAIAEALCRRQGGYLVKVNTGHEHNWIRRNLISINRVLKRKRSYWTGGNDVFHEGKWIWHIDYTKVLVKGWAPSQPDNHGKRQHCQLYWDRANYKWDDQNCHHRRFYICEKPAFGRPACTCRY